MRRKSKYRVTVTMIVMCIMINPMVLKATEFLSYHSDPIIDEGLPYYLLLAGFVELCFCIKYFVFYIGGECRSASFIKRLIVVVVFGFLTFVSLSPNQRVYRHNPEAYTVRTQYRPSLEAKVKTITVGDKTIPQGIYQVSISNNSDKINFVNYQGENSIAYYKKVFGTDSAGIVKHLEKQVYTNNGNSFTVVLPEASEVSIYSQNLKDFNTKVTFKKVDTLNEITHLSAEESGMYQIPNNSDNLKIDIDEKDKTRTYKGPLTNVFTFNEEQLIEYNVYKDAYTQTGYKVEGDKVLMESSDDHYYKDEDLENGQISLNLLDKAYTYSTNNLEFKNYTVGT